MLFNTSLTVGGQQANAKGQQAFWIVAAGVRLDLLVKLSIHFCFR